MRRKIPNQKRLVSGLDVPLDKAESVFVVELLQKSSRRFPCVDVRVKIANHIKLPMSSRNGQFSVSSSSLKSSHLLQVERSVPR